MYPVSWKIGNTGKILVVMYSIPYRYFGWCILHFECCIVIMDSVSHILASQDALEVMYVTKWTLADLTDVTLVMIPTEDYTDVAL